MSETLLIAIVTGAVSGLITWGGVLVALKYMSRDIDLALQGVHSLKNENVARKIETHLLAQKLEVELPHD